MTYTVAQLADIFQPLSVTNPSPEVRTNARYALVKIKNDHADAFANRLHQHHLAVKQRTDDLHVLAEGTDPQPSGVAKMLAGDDRW